MYWLETVAAYAIMHESASYTSDMSHRWNFFFILFFRSVLSFVEHLCTNLDVNSTNEYNTNTMNDASKVVVEMKVKRRYAKRDYFIVFI